jgi:hypothetical protein
MLAPRKLTPVETRAGLPDFVAQCGWRGLRPQLPLRWPAPPDIPPAPKRHYRSEYTYLGAADLENPSTWDTLEHFDLVLRLVDFSPLRPVLAQLLGWTAAQGQVPFAPVSLFLLCSWRIVNHWSRAATLRNLRKPRYADYAQRFGFRDGIYPTEGGVRYFLTTLGQNSPDTEHPIHLAAYGDSPAVDILPQRLNQLLVQAIYLLRAHGFISDAAWDQASVCPDGMLHSAASDLRCTCVTASCYQETAPHTPRPCPAQAKDRHGCACDTPACTLNCQYAPTRDPDARFIYYSGSNQPDTSPNRRTASTAKTTHGESVYGYKSIALRCVDAPHRINLTLLDDFGTATLTEADYATALLLQLPTAYPDLHLDAVASDAAYGYDRPLHTIYTDLHARRFVDLRAHATDRDKPGWVARGYDDRGRPLCPYGFRFLANGFDPQRHRSKWFCAQTCLHPDAQPTIPLPDVTYPPPECPYQAPDHAPYGEIRNLTETFPDGSLRLVRDAPVGSPTWKATYHRARNAVEARNSVLEAWELKRLPSYGTPRNRALIAFADTWDTLTTLARLCREATREPSQP